MAEKSKLPLLHYLEARKTSKHTEQSKELLASVDNITGSALKKDEQIRDLRRDLVFPDDDRFTISDGVPIVSVNDEEEDLNDEDEHQQP